MTTSGQFLSAERQARLTSYETSRRVVVGYAADFEDGLVTGTHAHPKAQLLYAVRGTMRIEATGSVFTVPPTTPGKFDRWPKKSKYQNGSVTLRKSLPHNDCISLY